MLTPEKQGWLGKAAVAAIASEKATGCPASLTLSQAIFESAWGERMPGNNALGIKADAHGSGKQAILTHEYLNGKWEEMPLEFETYDSLEDCFSDHARLIQSGIYAAAWADYQATGNLDRYIATVARHYATDPSYTQKIIAEAHSGTVHDALQQGREESAITA